MQTRLPLKEGTIVSSNNRDYQIMKVIGDGATSIVYEAFYIDGQNNPHSILLKECYPFLSEIFRDNTNLIWKNQSQYIKDIALFNDAYSKIMQFQNQDDIANGLSTAFDIFTQNNTSYIVFDKSFGKTFDKIDVKDVGLKTTLEIVLQLSNIVAKYHEYGYLHLDIKPSNFLVITEPNLFVKLFDIDTVILKDAVIQSSVVSYSEGYAAPEQLLKQKDKLSEATDIFAIGAVLFEKIMSRTVSNADLSPFATWEYTNFEDNLNPRIFRLLTRFFHKTLCANNKKRYQNIREPICDLNEIISIIVSGEPYIISNIYAPTNSFIGREKELKEIENLFNSNIKTVFIHGFGGVGKSELAKKYASVYSNNYDAITFINYKDSLEDSIKNIQLANYEGDITLSCLKKICSKNKVLIIVDNFDVSVDADNLLEELQEVSCDFIFTTRTDFSECLTDNQQQINLSSLEVEELYSLFVNESKLKTISAEDNLKIRDLLKLTSYHTLTAILLAKQIEKSGIGVNEILIQYQRGLDALLQEEKIVIKKDNRINKTSPLQMLRNTFRISNLSQDQKNVLEYLHLFDHEKLTKEKIRTLMRAFNNCINCLNDLVELGWVEVKNGILSTTYSLHPLIGELVKIEVCPNPENNKELIEQLEIHIPNLSDEFLNEDYEFLEIGKRDTAIKCEYLSALFYSLYKKGYVDFVAKKLCEIIDGNTEILEYFEDGSYLNYYFVKLKEELNSYNYNICNLEAQFYIINLLEIFNVEKTTYWLKGDKEKQSAIDCVIKLKSLFVKGIEIIKQLDVEDNSSFLWLLCKPIIKRVSTYSIDDCLFEYFKPIVEAIQQIEELFDIDEYWDIDFNDKKVEARNKLIGFDPNDTANIDNIWQEEAAKVFTPEEIDEYDNLERIETTIKSMFQAGLKVESIAKYIEKQNISITRKLESFWSIASDFFAKLERFGDVVQIRKDIAQLPWQRLLELLKYEEKFWWNTDIIEEDAACDYHDLCEAYRAVCCAYLEGRSKKFDEHARELVDVFKLEFGFAKRHNILDFYDFDTRCFRADLPVKCMGEFLDSLRFIEKEYLAFPYLIDCVNIVLPYAKSEEQMFSWYKTIVEFADEGMIWRSGGGNNISSKFVDYIFNKYRRIRNVPMLEEIPLFFDFVEQNKIEFSNEEKEYLYLSMVHQEYSLKIDSLIKPNHLKPIHDE